MLAFHASTNYQLQAPKPYDKDVHWDLLKGLEETRSEVYTSDFDFHRKVQQSLKRVNDGHLVYANWCYDGKPGMLNIESKAHLYGKGVYITYNPFPLVLLTNTTDQTQSIHISPISHQVASTAFGSKVKYWEDALGEPLENVSLLLLGLFTETDRWRVQFSGSRVIRINGEDSFTAVDANANASGGFEGLSSRQNA
jgi:hypothetical protein